MMLADGMSGCRWKRNLGTSRWAAHRQATSVGHHGGRGRVQL